MDIVDRSDSKSNFLVHGIGLRGKEDHRDIACQGIGLEATANFISVHPWHHTSSRIKSGFSEAEASTSAFSPLVATFVL